MKQIIVSCEDVELAFRHPDFVSRGILSLKDCECKCIRLYDGLNVAYAACVAITACWFPAAVRRLRS